MMARYAVYRVLLTLPLLFGAALLIFVVGRLAPGDPVAIRLGDRYDEQAARAIRHQLGLDRPLWVQFLHYAAGAVRLDFGESFVSPGRRVSGIVRQTLPLSLRLAAFAVAAAAVVGVAFGIVGSLAARSRLDRLLQLLVVVALSVPNFVVAALLVIVFALSLRLLPVAGIGGWESYVLPVTVLAVAPAAYISRVSRTSMLQVMAEDYVRTARAKGLASARIVGRHVLSNAALPIITTIGLAYGYALTGSFIVEVIFNIPGLGRVGVEGILQRDYTVIQAVVLIYTTLFIAVNLMVDLSYGFFNPRVRY
jgi:ABC-type dipeptide/oligopeptide/nickel transport system permease component